MPAIESTPARPLATIWELPDDLWEEVEAILDCFYPPARNGRPRADLRRVLDGIIHRLRSGCQPVPHGCLRAPERSFSGDPSGFDRIICPAR